MKKSFLFACTAAAMCLSCAKETIAPEDSSVKTVITVGIDQTKTTIGESEGGKHKIYWANGDKLNVNGTASEALSGVGEKQTSAEFTFKGLLDKPYSFLYPADYYKTASTVSLPATQADTASLPMYGYSASGLTANLKVLTAALQISLKQGDDTDDIKYIQISSDTQPLSGTFTINYQTGEITSTAAAADSKVRLSANCALSPTEAKTFVFSVPAGTYNLTVKVVDVNAHCMTKTLTDKTFTAGNYIILPELVFAPTTTEFDIHITTAAEWNAFADKFNNWKYTDDPTVSVSIDNDIDFTGVTPTLIGAYGLEVDNYCSALIDGNGHSFKNITDCDHPLVAAVNTSGIIRNLTIDETCSFASELNSSRQNHFGPFCEYLKGTLSGCVNKASVTVAPATSTTYANSNYVGGLVGRIREGKIENCTNSGAITVGANLTVSSEMVLGVGGLAGYMSNTNGSIENSTNTGTISVAATSNPLYVGGVVGNLVGSVDACTNSGPVSVSTARATGDPCKHIYFGGIAGVLSDAGASVNSCINSGSITSSSNVKIQRAGGIVGCVSKSGAIAGNTNSGDITFSAAARQIMAGGIIGSLENGGTYTFTGTPATGKIMINSIESSKDASYLYVGGLIGRVVPLNNPVIKGDKLASVCNISLTASDKIIYRGGMGGIVGAINLESTTNPTSVKIQDCDVSFLKNAGVRVPITSNTSPFMPSRMGVGGILGYAITGVKITDCDFGSAVNISKGGKKSNGYSADCGGIVGRLEGGESEISNCTVPSSGYIGNGHYNNNIVGDTGNATGGIIGRAIGTSISITGCSCAATMYAYRCAIGGIGGYLSNATVKGCTITGAITQGNYAGGLVGYTSASTFGGDSEGDACTFNCASGIISSIAGSCYNYAGGLAGQTVSRCKFINCGSYFGTTNGVTAQKASTEIDETHGNAPGSLIGNSDAGTTVTSCKAGGVMNCTLWGMPGASSVTSATLDATTVVSYAVGNEGFTPTSADVALWDGK